MKSAENEWILFGKAERIGTFKADLKNLPYYKPYSKMDCQKDGTLKLAST